MAARGAGAGACLVTGRRMAGERLDRMEVTMSPAGSKGGLRAKLAKRLKELRRKSLERRRRSANEKRRKSSAGT